MPDTYASLRCQDPQEHALSLEQCRTVVAGCTGGPLRGAPKGNQNALKHSILGSNPFCGDIRLRIREIMEDMKAECQAVMGKFQRCA
jgi:hypothetical protein